MKFWSHFDNEGSLRSFANRRQEDTVLGKKKIHRKVLHRGSHQAYAQPALMRGSQWWEDGGGLRGKGEEGAGEKGRGKGRGSSKDACSGPQISVWRQPLGNATGLTVFVKVFRARTLKSDWSRFRSWFCQILTLWHFGWQSISQRFSFPIPIVRAR